MKNKVMKKLVTMMSTLAIMTTSMVCIPQSVQAANTRDDGVWLFPLAKNSGYTITDWAGCTTSNYCTICGSYVNSTHQSWGDKPHGLTKYGHNGMDIGVKTGTPVLATAPGTFYCDSSGNGYNARGLFVVIEHPLDDKMSYYSYYQHLSEKSNFTNGSTVNIGDVVGKVGGTGGTAPDNYMPHLHYGMIIAPKGYFANNDGRSFSNKISTYEGKGWILNSNYGDGGRVLVNPKSLSVDGSTSPNLKTSITPSISAHTGSITYTFDLAKVTSRCINYSMPNISISGATYPSTLKEGSPFGTYGIISTDAGSITSVEAYIINADTDCVVDGYTFKYQPWSKEFNLKKTLNNDLIFNWLKPGSYRYVVGAYAVNGDKEKFQNLIDAPFIINAKEVPPTVTVPVVPEKIEVPTIPVTPAPVPASVPAPVPEPAPTPAPVVEQTPSAVYEIVQEDQKPVISVEGINHPDRVHKLGKNFGIRGIVKTDCGVITSVRGMIVGAQNGVNIRSLTYTPNATSCDLRYTINNDLIFDDLEAGTYGYYVIVQAVNGSQQTQRMYSFCFEVR